MDTYAHLGSSKWKGKILIIATLVVFGGGVVTEGTVIAPRRSECEVLKSRIARLESQARSLAADRNDELNKLGSAQRDLDLLNDEFATAGANRDPRREAEVEAWLTRMKKLERIFDQRPDQRIPEMQLLKQQDWIRLAKAAELDTDEQVRRTLAEVRSAAKGEFIQQLSTAVQKFTSATKRQFPSSVLELGPYFEKPIDPAMLQRYKVTQRGEDNSMKPSNRFIVETSPIDEEYDKQYNVQENGGYGSGGGPAWIDDFFGKLQRAGREYARMNNGKGPAAIAELGPYMNPPIAGAKLDKLLGREKRAKP